MTPSAEAVTPIVGTEVLTFKEGSHWIACWRRRDIVSQGGTEREAFDRLLRTIAVTAILDAEVGRSICGSAPPPDIVEKWERAHAVWHPELRLVK